MDPSTLSQYGYDPKANKVNLFVNLALVLQKKNELRESLENAQAALQLAPANEKIKVLVDKLQVQVKEQENSPDFQHRKKRVLKNHPNAESLSSQHSRKSSLVTNAILAKSGKQALEEEKDIDNTEIQVAPASQAIPAQDNIHRTRKEEQNHADGQLEGQHSRRARRARGGEGEGLAGGTGVRGGAHQGRRQRRPA